MLVAGAGLGSDMFCLTLLVLVSIASVSTHGFDSHG